jgi:hypothetical protein
LRTALLNTRNGPSPMLDEKALEKEAVEIGDIVLQIHEGIYLRILFVRILFS